MRTFACHDCQKEFAAGGRKVGWDDALMGACWKYEADCPSCGEPAGEHKPPMLSLHRADEGAQPTTAPVCATGTCPWVN